MAIGQFEPAGRQVARRLHRVHAAKRGVPGDELYTNDLLPERKSVPPLGAAASSCAATADLAAGDVLVEGERIAAVGPALPRPAGTEEIDATGCLVLPGLVNAHTHGHNNLLRGLAGRWTLEDLLNHGPR